MAYSDKPIVQGLWAEEQSAGAIVAGTHFPDRTWRVVCIVCDWRGVAHGWTNGSTCHLMLGRPLEFVCPQPYINQDINMI